LLILALAGYLIQQGVFGNGPLMPVETRVQLDHVGRAGERYVVPIEVHNRGDRTMRDAKVEVTHRTDPKAEPQSQDFTIDYLGEGSKQTIYLYVDSDPATLDVRVNVLHYRLE
jgi:uncharacterized protein (TIGR02588 family)